MKKKPKKIELPMIYFGSADYDPAKVDWRTALADQVEEDDDEILDPTPSDVIGMIGNDPLKLFGPKDGGRKRVKKK